MSSHKIDRHPLDCVLWMICLAGSPSYFLGLRWANKPVSYRTTSRAEARPVPCPFYLKPVQYYPTFYLITTEGIQSNSNMTQMAIWYNVQILGLWELRVKLPFDSIQIGLLELGVNFHLYMFQCFRCHFRYKYLLVCMAILVTRYFWEGILIWELLEVRQKLGTVSNETSKILKLILLFSFRWKLRATAEY